MAENALHADCTSLLAKIGNIAHKYQKISELDGSRFNLCSLLVGESDEVRLHSRLIGELLNPKGAHGMGNLLGDLFWKIVAKGEVQPNCQRTVKIEASSEFGRIDLLVEEKHPSGNRLLIIENKIWAGDQPKQLERYWQYAECKGYDKNYVTMLYLTPFGTEPDKQSEGRFSKQAKLASYQVDIIAWLDQCIKECAEKPFLRESLSMYRNVCKNITGQSICQEERNEMKESVFDFINKSKENFDAYFKICDLKADIVDGMASNVCDKIRELSIREGWVFQLSKKLTNRYGGFQLIHSELKGIPIQFEFQQDRMRGLIFGICNLKDQVDINNVVFCFGQEFEDVKKSDSWSAYTYWNDYKDWDRSHFYKALFEDSFSDAYRELLQRIECVLKKIASSSCQG